MRKTINITIIIALGLLLGLSIYQFRHKFSTKKIQPKILYWVAPMNPNYRRNKPGKSLMGMDLIPVYADQKSNQKGIVKISPTVEQNLGVTTAIAKHENIARIIDTVGYVTAPEDNIEHIHTYIDGWIKQLNVNKTGDIVHKGQLLFKFYSPTIINAQEEFLLALKNKDSSLIKASIKKLMTLGVSRQQIHSIQKQRRSTNLINIYATQNGIVSQLHIRPGMYVKPEKDLMVIEDLSHIWIIAEVFERQASWVKENQKAYATLPYMPGKIWQGKVNYVYPRLDAKTHTLRVRLVFPNPDLAIKPRMYANVKIISKTLKNVLTIPKSAIIRTGQGDHIILALGKGQYRAQSVHIGIEANQRVQIIHGLKPGDRVVTSAHFFIDSESNIQAGFKRIQHNHKNSTSSTNQTIQYIGTGIIKDINNQQKTISLDHEPIPALNMPAMHMNLPAAKNINLNKLNVGDKIHFILIKKKNHYLITKIHLIQKNKAK